MARRTLRQVKTDLIYSIIKVVEFVNFTKIECRINCLQLTKINALLPLDYTVC